MSRSTQKSHWIETEVERGGEVYLIPLRCRLEMRRRRLRTVIETFSLDTSKWTLSLKTDWVLSHKSLTRDQLDDSAQEIADILISDLEEGPYHPDWRLEGDGYADTLP